ncbi:MAG: 23S rRNA (adenine(2503)-C(2))-methyltransferase RlmN [Limnochordaceae bacterium]|nr:23S rRNA (adenine(2503)-C(2))-methyltransferase RlmN [Limnochordaceae bacterium]
MGGVPLLAGLTQAELEEWMASWPKPQPRYRARQLFEWIQARSARSFAEMTSLPLSLRQELEQKARVPALTLLLQRQAEDGTRKFLFGLVDGAQIESVFIPTPARNTVCLSTQAGCGMGCGFCATGQSGLQRNLDAAEIVDQVHWIIRQTGQPVDNLVYMGMGEPLANYAQTLRAVRLLNDPDGLNIGMRHQTLSTCGLVPQIRRLAQEKLQITLAVSLHAPNDALRDRLMPINQRYPLGELLPACREYVEVTGRRITFEYLLIDQVNDTREHARQLRQLLAGLLCHVNLIPFNPVPGLPWQPSRPERQRTFYEELQRANFSVTLRQARGGEIEAACGQLRREYRRTHPPARPVELQPLLASTDRRPLPGAVASRKTNEYS